MNNFESMNGPNEGLEDLSLTAADLDELSRIRELKYAEVIATAGEICSTWVSLKKFEDFEREEISKIASRAIDQARAAIKADDNYLSALDRIPLKEECDLHQLHYSVVRLCMAAHIFCATVEGPDDTGVDYTVMSQSPEDYPQSIPELEKAFSYIEHRTSELLFLAAAELAHSGELPENLARQYQSNQPLNPYEGD